MCIRLFVALLILACGIAQARANDSVAAHAIGGLELVETADIEMAEEDLFISLDEVRVRYVFINRSAKDITAMVAFPIPDIEFDEVSAYPFLGQQDEDITKFTINVDGKRVAAQREVRVFRGGEEDTKELIETGRPLIPLFGPHKDPFAPPFTAPWTVRIKYYWTQIFPAKAPVIVEHRYRPVVGNFPFEPYWDVMKQYYCGNGVYDGSLHSIIWSLLSPYPYAQHVHYILRTGNNWKGPIGRFKLTVELRHSFAVLYTCFPGLEDKGGGAYEFSADNYTPTHDLDLLVLGN